MSAEYWDNEQYAMLRIANSIENEVRVRAYGPYTEEQLAVLHEAAHSIKRAFAYAQAVALLLSADITSDDLSGTVRDELRQQGIVDGYGAEQIQMSDSILLSLHALHTGVVRDMKQIKGLMQDAVMQNRTLSRKMTNDRTE